MVYYQSTPLIIKSEQPSQAQLCAPLRNHHEPQHQTTQLQPATNNSYMLNNVNITTIQQHHQQQQQMTHNINSTSITTTNHHLQQQSQFLTNIKTELLPPGITLYATTQPASLTTQTATPTSTTTINNVTSSTPTTTGRKTNTNKPQFKCEQCGMTFGSKSAHTSHTKSHTKNGDLSLLNSGNSSTSGAVNSQAIAAGVEVNEAGIPLGIPKTPQIKPNVNAATNGGDPYQCNVCQKTFAVPARLVSFWKIYV